MVGKKNNMKVALVCIAKNEDNYIQEWVDYNKKLGFDDIFIYQNNWRCSIDEPNVIKIEYDGVTRQIPCYNEFIKNYKKDYDWAAFFDVDEFLVLKKHKNIKEFIFDYKDHNGIGVNWVLFGDNDLSEINNEYSVIKRFTKCQSIPNKHIKTILNLKEPNRMNVHGPNREIVDTNYRRIKGPFNDKGLINIAQLNHYAGKTKEEFILKCERGRADFKTGRNINEFDGLNFNEITDLTAHNFLYGNDIHNNL